MAEPDQAYQDFKREARGAQAPQQQDVRPQGSGTSSSQGAPVAIHFGADSNTRSLGSRVSSLKKFRDDATQIKKSAKKESSSRRKSGEQLTFGDCKAETLLKDPSVAEQQDQPTGLPPGHHPLRVRSREVTLQSAKRALAQEDTESRINPFLQHRTGTDYPSMANLSPATESPPKRANEPDASTALQSIVVELSSQVKGLHGLIKTEKSIKEHEKKQAEDLQQKYFQTLEDLQKDLVLFKTKMAEENRSMYSEF